VDPTAILVDMRNVPNKTGCFIWNTDACKIDPKKVSHIEFNVNINNCGDVWAAPLWLVPHPWNEPPGLSGEIDMVECCVVGEVHTNFAGCYGAPKGLCNEERWGSASSIGPKKYTLTFAANGDVSGRVCDLSSGGNCQSAGSYNNFLDTVNPCKDKSTCDLYSFVSDVFNGHSGDAGWNGCKAKNSPSTSCEYAVSKIRVHSSSGTPPFTEGKCTTLNGDARDISGTIFF